MQLSTQNPSYSATNSGLSYTNSILSGSSSISKQVPNDQGLKTFKSENENYGFKKIYGPYLAPSAVVIKERADQEQGTNILFMHNIARTKYFNISQPAKPIDHYKINLLA